MLYHLWKVIEIEVKSIPVERIRVKREQVRESFDEDRLNMLAESIASSANCSRSSFKKMARIISSLPEKGD